MPLINCDVKLNLLCSKECAISEIPIKPATAGNPNARRPVTDRPAGQITVAAFEINNAKLYVIVVTLSINDNIKLLENMKQTFKRTISRNKYRSELTK